jgi:peptide/nickel transport system substrate-binding protein
VLLSASLLAACGESGGGDSGSEGSSGTTAEESSIQTIDPFGGNPDDEPKPKSGGVLTIGADRAEISFDPVVGGSNVGAIAIYDLLMKLDEDGNPEPYLAKSMETSDEGTTWTMELREGVNFSDGTPLNAEAVLINTQRHMDNPKSRAQLFAKQIASMRAVDDLTVEFKLAKANGLFPVLWAQGFATGTLGIIMSPAAIAQWGDQIGAHPVGAGPFTLTEWVRDSKVTLAKNPNYWQKGLPRLDGIEIRPIPDTDARYASLENGDIDISTGAYQPELYKAVRDDNIRVYYGSGHGAETTHFNFTKAPFDDRRMREAWIRAIDEDAMAATQFQGDMVDVDQYFGVDTPYYSKKADEIWPDYDPAKAKALVQEYVADGGSATVEYATTNAANRVAFAQFLQAQMKEVGIDMKIATYDLAQYAGAVVLGGNFNAAGNVAGPVDNPYPQVNNIFGTGGNTNYGKYSNPKVDTLLAEATATTDEKERAEIYQELSEIINTDLVVNFTNAGYLSTLTQTDVYGVQRTLNRDMFLETTWLDR